MTTVTATRPRVQPIPADSDGLLVPRLIPVAAHLCAEEYPDAARSRILERLADGVSPRVCCLQGVLEWGDLAEVERLLAPRPAAAPAPIAGGAPRRDEWGSSPGAESLWVPLDDRWELRPGFADPSSWPAEKTAADRAADRADVIEWHREHPGG